MYLENYKVTETPASDIWIIGEREIGDKAGQLVQKTASLREIGFRTPPRYVLAEGFLDNFFQKNNLGKDLRDAGADPEIEAKIRNDKLTAEQFGVLQKIHNFLADYPALAVRSSAKGDARGTGIYTSEFCPNDLGSISKSIQVVLASYFSEDARLFRKDAQAGEGFGIMIEPLVGQRIEGADGLDEGVSSLFCHYTSILSGYGYSSTLHDKGYISAVLGLGGGVQLRDGERIGREDIEQVKNMGQYMLKRLRQTLGLRRSDMIDSFHQQSSYEFSFRGIDAYLLDKGDRSHLNDIKFPEDIGNSLRNVTLLPFFNMLNRTELIWGKQQYLEWAMTLDSKDPAFWILQIADVEKRIDSLDFIRDFEDHGTPLFVAQNVSGSGVRDSDTVVLLNNPFFKEMHQFNQSNQDYVLIYEDRLSSSTISEHLRYSHLSNSHTVLELPWTALSGDPVHAGNPIAHFEGMLERTGKFFGVVQGAILGGSREVWQNVDSLKEKMHLQSSSDIEIYRGPVRVVADERQNRLLLYKR